MKVPNHPSIRPQSRLLLLPVLVVFTLGGCATQEFVHQEVGQYGERLRNLESWLSTITQGIDTNAHRIMEAEARLDRVERTSTSLGGRLDETLAGIGGANLRIERLVADLRTTNQRIETGNLEMAKANQRLESMDVRLNAVYRHAEGAVSGLAMAESRIGALEKGVPQAAVPGKAAGEALALSSTPSEPAPGASVSLTPVRVALPCEAQSVQSARVMQTATATTQVNDSNGRLDTYSAMFAEVNRKLERHGDTLTATSNRLVGLEAGLAASGQRGQEQDTALKATNQRLGELQSDLGQLRRQSEANAEAISQIDKRVMNVDSDLEAARIRVEAGEKVLAESGLRLTMVQELLKGQGERLSRNEIEDGKVSTTALEALERARLAGKLAEGKLVFETTLADEVTNFGFQDARLGEAARKQLNEFASRLKSENQGVYIEIQGHTDNVGSADVNMRLSRARAEAVRDYLNREAGIPMHRLAVAAYGETKPVADNRMREGRGKNRRVVLVVLK